MRRATRYMLPVAGLVAIAAAACAGAQHPTPAEQAQQNLSRAQQDLSKAQQEEKNAADQQKNVAAAHEKTSKAEQQLAEAQKKEGEQRAKAQQLQQQANQHMREAQQSASALQQGGLYAQGQRTISGHLLQAHPNQIVLQARNGETVSLDVNDRTRVLIGGEPRSAADLQQGADARVAYDDTTGTPTAVTIQVQRAGSRPASVPSAGTRAIPMPGSQDTQDTRSH